MESKFRNNLVTTTDRIDAQTLVYQARVNLELAKSDATIAYYNLVKINRTYTTLNTGSVDRDNFL